MGVCASTDIISKRLKEFLKQFPHFNIEEQNNTKHKKIEGQETKMYEHYKAFTKYKDEIQKTNKHVYDSFFNTKDKGKSTSIELKNLKTDDEEKFLFFFNLRGFEKVTIKDSYLNFPRFSLCYYPKFRPCESLLTNIVINNSIIIFDESQEGYNRIKKVTYMDLSYNNIENLPIFFKKLINLVYLNLRRNNIFHLSSQMNSLNKLVELDLSENKFKRIPDVCFELQSLEILNLNSNQIDMVETSKKNYKLTSLFLANNCFNSIPHDIVNLEVLSHLALDNNKISELNANTLSECKSLLKITLSNNLIKNREGVYIGFNNDLLIIDPSKNEQFGKNQKNKDTKDTSYDEELISIHKKDVINTNQNQNQNKNKVNFNTITKVKAKNQSRNSSFRYENKDKNVSFNNMDKSEENDSSESILQEGIDEKKKKIDTISLETRKKNLIDEILYKNVYHIQEIKLNNRINEQLSMLNLPLSYEDQQIKESLINKKKIIVKDFLKELIDKKLDSEIGKFNDVELKIDIKAMYFELSKEKIKSTWKIKDTVEIGDESVKVLKEKYCKNNDLGNLVFLKTLHNCLTMSKVKILLQYLRNIDSQLYKYMKDLIEEHEVYSLTLILTELKLFMREIIDYYKKNIVGYMEIVYEHKIFNNTNVIHRIFQETSTLKMLYNLGLYEIRNETYDIVTFVINNITHIKHELIENYLGRLINEIKNMKNIILLD